MSRLPDPLAKVTVGCMNLLWVDKLPVGSNDIELVLIDADLQFVVRTGMNEIDPDPFLAVRCLEHLEWREGLLTDLLVGVQILIRLHEAAKGVPTWPTNRLNEFWRVTEGPALAVEDDGIATPWHDASVSVHDEEDVHRLRVPIADYDVMRTLFCLSDGLNVVL